jgi:hypothetical protein
MAFIQELPYIAQNVSSVTTFAIDLSSIRAKNQRGVSAEVEVTGANVTVKFGYNNSVAASYTITSNTFPAGNYHCTAGTVKTLQVPSAATHFSICPIAGGTAQVAINFGFERD